MAFDPDLAEHLRHRLKGRKGVVEKKMFGGLSFMVAGHMCCGVTKTDFVFRIGEEAQRAAMGEPHVRPMDFTGRPMKSMIYVSPDVVEDDMDLDKWTGQALDFCASLPPK